MKENKEVREAARSSGVPLWRVAAAIGISEPTITRWLRFPLSGERKTEIMAAITRLSKEGN